MLRVEFRVAIGCTNDGLDNDEALLMIPLVKYCDMLGGATELPPPKDKNASLIGLAAAQLIPQKMIWQSPITRDV